MTEILNLSSLCRCCHSVGDFKRLDRLCWIEEINETYSFMLDETFGLKVNSLSPIVSYSICNNCILRVCDTYLFKCQVLSCEKKFYEYCRNEEALELDTNGIKIEEDDTQYDEVEVKNDSIKLEIDNEDCIEYEETTTELPAIIESIENKSNDNEQIEKKPKQNNGLQKNSMKGQIRRSRRKKSDGLTRFERSFVTTNNIDDNITYSCKLCGGNYQHDEEMREHVMKTHSQYDCAICRKICININRWNYHMAKHEKKQYTCEFCNENFISSVGVHYKCDICNISTSIKSCLVTHMKKHMGTHPVVLCDICGWKFNDISNMKAHRQAVHEKLKPYCCKICQIKVATKKSLRNHMLIHTSRSKYPCESCGKYLASKETLAVHKLTHDKIYMCRKKHCKNTFDNKILYLAHIRAHRRKGVCAVIKCHICGNEFTTNYSLKKHMVIHKGIKAFACDVCGKKFMHKDGMERHRLRLHVPGGKERFRDKVNKDLKCEICGIKYRHRSGLSRHIVKKHSIKVDEDAQKGYI